MTIVETRICTQTGKSFAVTQHEVDVLAQISPVCWWKKYDIPLPVVHPDVDHQWHYAWRNERTLYRTTCALTWVPIITCVNPHQWYTIYNFHDWWSDAWNPMEYGQEVDLSASFTEQFAQLFHGMPQMSLNLTASHMDNCDYCNYGYHAKDCYMCTTPCFSEKCYYTYLPLRCYYDVDGYANTDCQYTYGCVYAQKCYTCQDCYYSTDCKHAYFLLDCRNCEYCFGCVNLTHKKYCFFNEQLTKEVYIQRVEAYLSNTPRKEIKSTFATFTLQFPRRATRGKGNEEVSGDLNFNMSNCYYCFDMQDAKDMTYCRLWGIQASDFVRCTLVWLSTRLYACTGQAESDSCAFCVWSNTCYQVFYSYYCRNCEHCFGCVWLQHKKYCLFNKQYTKEAYEEILAQLIIKMQQTGERGQWLNPSLAPFPYNDTCAQERFPETKEAVLMKGWQRIDYEQAPFVGEALTPQPIEHYMKKEQQEKILWWTLVCEVSWRPYRVIQQELDFYLKFRLPLPTKHHEQRYQERIARWLLPRTLFERTCAKTKLPILTPYAPERPEIVWSEESWDSEFLG